MSQSNDDTHPTCEEQVEDVVRAYPEQGPTRIEYAVIALTVIGAAVATQVFGHEFIRQVLSTLGTNGT